MEKEKIRLQIKSNLRKKMMASLNRKVRMQTKAELKVREARDVPGMVRKTLKIKVEEKLAMAVKKAGVELEKSLKSPEDSPQKVKLSATALKTLSMATCKPYDSSRRFSCERGAQKCLDVRGKRVGCTSGSMYTYADWSVTNGYKVQARGGFHVEMYKWRKAVM